jgi:hypothetical protein
MCWSSVRTVAFSYISRVLPALDIRETRMAELDLLWSDSGSGSGVGRGLDSVQTARVKSDGRMAAVLRRAVDSLVRVTRCRVQPWST